MYTKIRTNFNQNKFFHPSPIRFDDEGLVSYSKVWRSDTRRPKELKETNGFQSYGTNPNLKLHVLSYSNSAYIGFGNSLLDATKFCRPLFLKKQMPFLGLGSYLYKTNLPKIHINVRKSYIASGLTSNGFIGRNYAEIENEYAAVHSVPYTDIQKARRYLALPELGVPYVFIGGLYINPQYQPRNWSISIPSASLDEASYYESESRKYNLLENDKRFIKYAEAIQISGILEKEAQQYKISNDPHMIIFEKLPSHLDEKKAIDFIVNEYQIFSRLTADKISSNFSLFNCKADSNSGDKTSEVTSKNNLTP